MTTFLLALLLCLTPVPAGATVLFTWTGTCVLTCTGVATFHVAVADPYVPGTVGFPPYLGGATQLLVAQYTDNLVTIDVAPRWPVSGEGLWLAEGPEGHLDLFGDALDSDAHGVWHFGSLNLPGPVPDSFYYATGVGAVWTDPLAIRVPWPTWLLALGALGLAGWHRVGHAQREGR